MSIITRSLLRDMRKDPFIMWSAVGAVAGITSCILFVLYYHSRMPGSIPLFYSLPWGDERLVPRDTLIFLLIGTFGIIMVNGMIEVLLYTYETLLSRMIAVGSFIITLLTIYTIMRIVLVIV